MFMFCCVFLPVTQFLPCFMPIFGFPIPVHILFHYFLLGLIDLVYLFIHKLPTLLYTLLGPPFAFRTALILCGIDSTRCWKHSSEILVHIDMIASRSCCRFVGCTSMMRISLSTTSQMCSIGLRYGDCGGHLSKVNSLSYSKKQFEMI